MIITLVKKLNGKEFIMDMEKTYKSITELEKLFEFDDTEIKIEDSTKRM